MNAITDVAVASCAGRRAARARSTNVPFANGIPVAPEMPIPSMPDGPVEYPTAEGMRIRVSVVTRGISHPWSIAFLPNDVWLVTQTHGGLRVVRNGVLDPTPVEGAPEVKPLRRSGLLEVTLHPRFADNQLVYLTYHKGLADDKGALALARARWDGQALRDLRDLFVTQPDSGTVSRMIFGPRRQDLHVDGRRRRAGSEHACGQDPAAQRRRQRSARQPIRRPRRLPARNLHSRSPHDARSRRASRHGADLAEREWPERRRRDQRARPRRQLRLAARELGAHLPGSLALAEVSGRRLHRSDRLLDAVDRSLRASRSIRATGCRSGKATYSSAALRTGEIIGTGQIQRILFNEKMEELRREALLTDWRHRMRDIRQGPDGLLYVLVDDEDGAILRIEPAL